MIEPTRADIVAEARTWIGTPYQHQARVRGIGCDCGGLIGAVGVAVGAFPANAWAAEFAPHAGYARTPANGMLEAICQRFLRAIGLAAVQPGDVVLMRFSVEPQHLGILAPYHLGGLSLIHAYSHARPGRVVEHRLADVWRARVVQAFAFPGVGA